MLEKPTKDRGISPKSEDSLTETEGQEIIKKKATKKPRKKRERDYCGFKTINNGEGVLEPLIVYVPSHHGRTRPYAFEEENLVEIYRSSSPYKIGLREEDNNVSTEEE